LLGHVGSPDIEFFQFRQALQMNETSVANVRVFQPEFPEVLESREMKQARVGEPRLMEAEPVELRKRVQICDPCIRYAARGQINWAERSQFANRTKMIICGGVS